MKIAYIDYSIATKSLDIFFAGCNPPYCEGCCNPELCSFDTGEDWMDVLQKIDDYLDNYTGLIENIFLLGGSPNHQNMEDMNYFLAYLFYLHTCENGIKTWLFAREEIENINPLFHVCCDYIKCGEYIPTLTCEDNIQYGIKLATSNQKIYKQGIDYRKGQNDFVD